MYLDGRSAFQVASRAVAGTGHTVKSASQKSFEDAKPGLTAKLAGGGLTQSEQYLRASDVAKQVGMDIEFSIANMTLSKWAARNGAISASSCLRPHH